MKKFLGLVLALLAFAVISASADGGSTWIKLSLWPPLTVPSNGVVHGVDIALISSIVDEMHGVQLDFIYAQSKGDMFGYQSGGFVAMAGTKMYGVQEAFAYAYAGEKMHGIQEAIYAKAGQASGIQDGIVAINDSIDGVQCGIWNQSKSVRGLQLGIVNITEDMQGIQIGLINNIKNSGLPWMIIANAKFK